MLTWSAPTIGPRVYLSSGPSGWAETFKRPEADRALAQILGVIPVKLAIEDFIRVRAAEKTHTSCALICDYLVKLCQVPEAALTPAIVVAFWAAVLLESTACRGN